MTCNLPIASDGVCPNEATFEARKDGRRYNVYCGPHHDQLRPLWDKLGVRITTKPL